MNANQVFTWGAGAAAEKAACGCRWNGGAGGIVLERRQRRSDGRHRGAGVIEIEFDGGARVSIRGEVAPQTLRRAFELLR